MDQSSIICWHGEASAPFSIPLSEIACDTPQENPPRADAAKRRWPRLLWGLGGTILSVVGFIAMLLFEQYNAMQAELRNDLKHFNELSGEFVKKDTLNRYRDHMKDFFKELHASNVARSQIEQELRASEKARAETASELQRMRERLSFLEGQHSAATGAHAAYANPDR